MLENQAVIKKYSTSCYKAWKHKSQIGEGFFYPWIVNHAVESLEPEVQRVLREDGYTDDHIRLEDLCSWASMKDPKVSRNISNQFIFQ